MVAPIIMSIFGPLIQNVMIAGIGRAMNNMFTHPWVDSAYDDLEVFATQHNIELPTMPTPLKMWMAGYYRIATGTADNTVIEDMEVVLVKGVTLASSAGGEFKWLRELLQEFGNLETLSQAVIDNMVSHPRQFPHQPFLEQLAIIMKTPVQSERELAFDSLFDLEKRHDGLIAGAFGKTTYHKLEPLVDSLRHTPYMNHLRES